MAVLALILIAIWIVLVAGVRGYLQARATGSIGLRAADRRGSPQWWSRRISTVGVLLAIAAPIAELAGVAPFAPLDQPPIQAVGVALFVIGIVITVVSQRTMGSSWRGDVDPEARTPLVTTGLFRYVRNPILSATLVTTLGLALIVPNALSAAMLVAFAIAMEVQVRLVEEPYLQQVHGEAYARYAARTGRFVPGIGRLERRPTARV